jgi:lipopolysaccharide transport system permease protein
MMDSRSARAHPFPFLGQHRSLALELARRDAFGRYRGASLGVVWSILTPFLMLGVYSLAFGEILRARWPGVESSADFALILFVGLILHGFLAECLTRAPTLVTANSNYVKRIIFPLEVLPWPMVLSGLFHVSMNFGVLALATYLLKGSVPWTFVLVIPVLIPLVLIALGCGWLLGALGVYLRDISQVTGPVATALLFLSSAIVPVQALPERFQWVFRLNPLTPVIDQAREATLFGQVPDGAALLLHTLPALAWALASYAVFRRLRYGFSDVL